MKRAILLGALLVLSMTVLAQMPEETQSFTLVQQIGRARPQGIQYNPNLDQVALVDLEGRLVLAHAADFTPQHIIYEQGAYNAYRFSHDGHLLAIALATRVELWDAQTGALRATFEPEGALSVTGPLYFAGEDDLLLLNTVVPAPAATRRSENDTSIIPWVWDVPAALGEASTTLRTREDFAPFFNFRNGLVLGPNDTLVAAVPNRLQLIDASGRDLANVYAEVETGRFEQDPLNIWQSATDDLMYVRPIRQGGLVQIDTRNQTSATLPISRDITNDQLELVEGLATTSLTRLIGAPNNQTDNALLRLLYGEVAPGSEPITTILIDVLEPMTAAAAQNGLLIYRRFENQQRAVLEFLRPLDVEQMRLSPDRNHLLVRRSSRDQRLEVYDLTTGILEQTYYPFATDNDGTHLLAYNQDGSIITSDFQRFDAQTGATRYLDQDYGTRFDQVYFSADGQALITTSHQMWLSWDIRSGERLLQRPLNARGAILEVSDDRRRYLTQYEGDGQLIFEIFDVGTLERQIIPLDVLSGRQIEQIHYSPDWQRYLIVYAPARGSAHYPGNEVAVHTAQDGQVLFLAGDDLPAIEGREYGWLDDATVYIAANQDGVQPQRVYGVDFHVSGLPQCMVDAYPEDWPELLDLWEQLAYRLTAQRLSQLTQTLCVALPETAGLVSDVLTPTPAFRYRSDATRIPYVVSGVPTCLTSRFRREALDFAEDWRMMTEGLDAAQIAELEVMLCQGLISSVDNVRPTPTVDPNVIAAATPTQPPAGPASDTVAQVLNRDVMTVDINTGTRLRGTFLPTPEPRRVNRNLDLIIAEFSRQFGIFPINPVLSADGRYLAVITEAGFVQIYELGIPYPQLAATATQSRLAQQTAAPVSVGLQPSATPGFDYDGQPRPTLTPTITPTAPPPVATYVAQAQYQQVVQVCPFDQLFHVAEPPPGYAPTGQLVVPQLAEPIPWVLQPEDGSLTANDALPRCDQGLCYFSPDMNWIVRVDDEAGILVSRPDGSGVTVLWPPEEQVIWPELRWTSDNQLEYRVTVYDETDDLPPLRRFVRFDPVTQTLSEPFAPPARITINELPTERHALQPIVARFAVVSTPYDAASTTERKYYIYDYTTETATYFARTGDLELNWHPNGTALYYRYPRDGEWFIFDPATQEHRVFGALPYFNGTHSRDRRYTIRWVNEGNSSVLDQERPSKLSIYDSETGLVRRYCLPETGFQQYNAAFTWSPDNRYVAFRIDLPFDGDDPLASVVQRATLQATLATPTLLPSPTALADAIDARVIATSEPLRISPTPPPTTTPQAGALFNVPTLPPATAFPTPTPIPLAVQYALAAPRTLLLDTETGSVTIISDEVGDVLFWINDEEGAE